MAGILKAKIANRSQTAAIKSARLKSQAYRFPVLVTESDKENSQG
jgi:predicted transcriptional regulator